MHSRLNSNADGTTVSRRRPERWTEMHGETDVWTAAHDAFAAPVERGVSAAAQTRVLTTMPEALQCIICAVTQLPLRGTWLMDAAAARGFRGEPS